MVGGEGSVEGRGAEKVSLRVVHVRAITKGDELDRLTDCKAVHESFTAEEAGLTGLRGIACKTP